MVNLRYKDINIVLQEIPDEISLSISITGCQLACKGCHSSYLWKRGSGNILTDDILIDFMNKYSDKISCVLFMGGEWLPSELLHKLKLVNTFGLKTALYTGLDYQEIKDISNELLSELDYIKVGRWVEELGGLDSIKTNQQFIKLYKNI